MLGHGFSEGHRFYIPNGDWTINRDDLESFAKFVVKEHGDQIPLFMAGDSYGACLTIHVAKFWQNHPENAPSSFKGIGLFCPAIIGDLPPYIVVLLLRHCMAPFFPTWTPFFMPHPVNPDRLWRNEEVRKEFSSGRDQEIGLSGGGKPYMLGTAVGLLTALESVREEAIPGLKVPFCVSHGTDDFSVPIAGMDFLLEHSMTPEEDRAVRKVEGGYHDLLAESSREETAMFFINWMNRRISTDN